MDRRSFTNSGGALDVKEIEITFSSIREGITVLSQQVIRPPLVIRRFSVLSTSRVYAPAENRALNWPPPKSDSV